MELRPLSAGRPWRIFGLAEDLGGTIPPSVQSLARMVAKYMQEIHRRGPSMEDRVGDLGVRLLLPTITFRTLYVFFVIHPASRRGLHAQVTPYPTAEWTVAK